MAKAGGGGADEFYGQPPGDDFYEDIPSQAGQWSNQSSEPTWMNPQGDAWMAPTAAATYSSKQGLLSEQPQPDAQSIPVHTAVEGDPAGGGAQPPEQPQQKASLGLKHPFAAFFHLLFRISALVCYLVLSTSFVVTAEILVTLLAMDFWTVKNVTGRLLVGLRWWNEIKPDGTSEWIFESLEGQRQIDPKEAAIFWGGLLLMPLIWIILFIFALFSLEAENLVLIILALTLDGANVYGYIRCARDAKKRVNQLATNLVLQNATSLFTSGISR